MYSWLLRSCALPWISVLSDSKFWQLYCDFSRNPVEALYSPSPDEVFCKLQALLKHAYECVLFYRERLANAGMKPESFTCLEDFGRIPPTTKADLEANFPDRVMASDRAFGPWRYVSTSGMIERMTVIHDFRKRDYARAAHLLAMRSATGY